MSGGGLYKGHGRSYRFVLVALPIALIAALTLLEGNRSSPVGDSGSSFLLRNEEAQCYVDPSIPDTCAFVRKHCADFADDGFVNYFQTFYCAPDRARPFLMAGMVLWLIMIFGAMAVVASDHLAIHLEVLVKTIGISQNLAGVTLFALANGSSDLFSTSAAMSSNSGSLAINELFGAAAFITSVVLGLVAVVRPFAVNPKIFMGEVSWFIIAASFLIAFLSDGELVLAECLCLIGLYIAFVCFAMSQSHTNHDVSNHNHSSDGSDLTPVVGPVEALTAEPEEITPLLPSTQGEIHQSAESGAVFHAMSEPPKLISPTVKKDLVRTSVVASDESADPETTEDPLHRALSTTSALRRASLQVYPSLSSWTEMSQGEKTLAAISWPITTLVGLSVPSPRTERYFDPSNVAIQLGSPKLSTLIRLEWMFVAQTIAAAQFTAIMIYKQSDLVDPGIQNLVISIVVGLLVAAVVVSYSLATRYYHGHCEDNRLSKPHHFAMQTCLVSILSFASSITWVYCISTTAVSLLETLSSITRIPNPIAGAIVFAIGNSSNDIFANTAVARRGSPVLAASACLGAPMLNTLLGIGIGGLIQILRGGNNDSNNATGAADVSYSFNVTPTLFVSATNLLSGLVFTLAYAYCNSWILDKKYGYSLIALWTTFATGNIALSIFSPS